MSLSTSVIESWLWDQYIRNGILSCLIKLNLIIILVLPNWFESIRISIIDMQQSKISKKFSIYYFQLMIDSSLLILTIKNIITLHRSLLWKRKIWEFRSGGRRKYLTCKLRLRGQKKTVYSWSVFIIHIHHSSTSKLMVSCSKSSSKSSLICSNINM